jgi:hypothetical protein
VVSGARWQRWRHARREDVGALSSICLFFLLFFGGTLASGRFLIAADAFYQSYPLRTVAWGMLRGGEWPLWTPLVFAGYPLLSMGQLSLGYPFTWGYLFLPGHWAEQIYLLTPFLLSPVFTYIYARQTGRSPLAALLAGLCYGYGGGMTSKLAVVGFHSNAFLWLPLLLVPIERARTRRFIPCLLGATGAYALCVLNGYGQGLLYVGIVAVLYATFISLTGSVTRDNENAEASHDDESAEASHDESAEALLNEGSAGASPGDKSAGVSPGEGERAGAAASSRVAAASSSRLARWRPLGVALGGIALASGVSAFQILETMRAARRSIRSTLTYEVFSSGSFTPQEAVRSFFAPLYHYIEVSAYVAPLAAGLAVYGVVRACRRGSGDARVFFWLALAVVSFMLMLGTATPLNWLSYHAPVYNRFRYPSRHAFELTFAVSILAAYGWDALRPSASTRARASLNFLRRARLPAATLALLLSILTAAFWWQATTRTLIPFAGPDTGRGTTLPETSYLRWKLAFTLLICAATWWGKSVPEASRPRTSLLAATLLLAFFVEPFIMASCWWFPDAKPASRFHEVSPAVRMLQGYPPEENRVYTRVELYLSPRYTVPSPPLDLPNLPALQGIQNIAGYEQLVLERFSRALGNVGPDAVNPRYDMPGAPDASVFADRSHVLDLLNTTFVAAFANLATTPEPTLQKEGVQLSARDLNHALQPGETLTLHAQTTADTFALVSSLSNSVDVADGHTVARLRLFTADGQVTEQSVRAGADTSEWAHERPDVRAAIRHRLAPVFDSAPGDAANSFPSHRYWARINLGASLNLRRIEITNTTPAATLNLSKATLYDSVQNRAAPLSATPHGLSPARWETAFEQDGVLVVRNLRALPRAWLVAEAEAVDGEEALRRIRGESGGDGSGINGGSAQKFDPRRTALLEVGADELPRLPGGALAPESTIRLLQYQPARLTLETNAPTPTVAVISEIFYPGWEATVDGVAQPIYLTNFLLRGVSVPAGQHRIEMRYRAPAARTGALISLSTLLLIILLSVFARRARRAHARDLGDYRVGR